MARPQHSTEPAFQLMMAFVHAFCAVISFSGCVYHLRRTRGEAPTKGGPADDGTGRR